MHAALLDLLTNQRESWLADALCAQVDPDLWFPEPGQSSEPAKRICRECPVRVQCEQRAIDNGELHGVWGAASTTERRALRRQDRTAA